MPKPVRVHTENVNSYGYRILTSGMDWSQFDKNPILLYNHLRHTSSYEESNKLIFPIGKWNDRKMVGGDVVMTPEFDEEDEYGKEVMRKWDKNYLNTASVSVRVVAISEDPATMLPGQTRPTITQCIVKEVSIVDIPGNADCYKLFFEDGTVLSLDGDQAPEELNKVLPRISLTSNTKKMNELKLVAGVMGLPEDAEIAKLVAKATELMNNNAALTAQVTSLSAENALLKKTAEGDRVAQLVDGAINAGKLTAAQRDTWMKLAEGNFDNTKAALDTMLAYTPPTLHIDKGGNAGATDVDRFLTLAKEGKLNSLSAEERTQLEDAYAEHLRVTGVVKSSNK